MKPATVTQLKYQLNEKSTDELVQICLRLAKFKKENKELLSYLLFETDEQTYIKDVSLAINDQLGDINTSHIYYTKKSIRKIVRFLNKFIRYSGNKETELQLRVHFLQQLLLMKLPFSTSIQLQNIYNRELIKIQTVFKKLHEDIQFDYRDQLEYLQNKRF